MGKNGASSLKTNYIDILSDILNPEGHQNHCIGSKVTVILMNGWILPTGGASSGRVCACSLCSRLVFKALALLFCVKAPLGRCWRWRRGGILKKCLKASLQWCYYPHWSGDALSPVFGIFFTHKHASCYHLHQNNQMYCIHRKYI